MRITGLELADNRESVTLSFTIRDIANQFPYQVKGATGLDADDIATVYYGASSVGEKYHDLTLQKRVISLKLNLNPNAAIGSSYSKLRDDVYKLIAATRSGLITLRLLEDTITKAQISGFITKVESDLFSKNPDIGITIECEYPLFRSPSDIYVQDQYLETFPDVVHDEHSTAPHGLTLFAQCLTDFPSFIMTDDNSEWSFNVSPLGGFFAGDILTVSNETNEKLLSITRGSSVIHLADALQPNSVWPVIFPGDNVILCNANVSWLGILYKATYWGV